MDTFNGMAPAVDADHFIDKLAFKFHVVAKTASYTPKLRESGTFFTTEGASGAIVFTLPAVASSDGIVYWFYSAEIQNMTITAPANTMVAGSDATATNVVFSDATGKCGNCVMVVGNGTLWHAFPMTAQNDVVITVT